MKLFKHGILVLILVFFAVTAGGQAAASPSYSSDGTCGSCHTWETMAEFEKTMGAGSTAQQAPGSGRTPSGTQADSGQPPSKPAENEASSQAGDNPVVKQNTGQPAGAAREPAPAETSTASRAEVSQATPRNQARRSSNLWVVLPVIVLGAIALGLLKRR